MRVCQGFDSKEALRHMAAAPGNREGKTVFKETPVDFLAGLHGVQDLPAHKTQRPIRASSSKDEVALRIEESHRH